MVEAEQFAQELRLYKRHQLYFWLGVLLSVVGFAFSFWTKQTLASLGAPFSMASAYYAWVGGKAMNVSFGATPRSGMDTRSYEEMSPAKRRAHAKRVAVGLVFFALAAIGMDAFVLFAAHNPERAGRMFESL
jgi:hypothetical protein